jgi:hypothetical protein
MTQLPTGTIQHRLADGDTIVGRPATYNARDHTIAAVLSRGNVVKRPYGLVSLKIAPGSIDVTRVQAGLAPLLDCHRQDSIDSILGKLSDVWIEDGALLGTLQFAQTERGQLAEGMVERGELSSLSIGYRVDSWEITDADGKVVDPERDRIAWDEDLNFEATNWQLLECSMVGVAADAAAMVRSLSSDNIANVKARMMARARMYARQGRLLSR